MIKMTIIVAWLGMTAVTVYGWNRTLGLKDISKTSVADILTALVLWPLLLMCVIMELLNKIKPFKKKGE